MSRRPRAGGCAVRIWSALRGSPSKPKDVFNVATSTTTIGSWSTTTCRTRSWLVASIGIELGTACRRTPTSAIMKQPYRWRCFACDRPNEPLATSCASCGFPARASGAEIAKARAARAIGASYAHRPEGSPAVLVQGGVAKWSGWRKGLVIAGAALLAISGLAWSRPLSWPSFTVALLALIFGGILLLVACLATENTERSTGGTDG